MAAITNSLNSNLEKRVAELEKKLNELSKSSGKTGFFGSAQTTVGTSSSDLTLKTRGKVKILYGNIFIDLLKDGKLNVDSECIFKVSNKDSIKNKNGIYLTDEGEVYLKLKNQDPINLIGEVGTTYVSFLGKQETSSENKYQALTNIGFLYSNQESFNDSSLLNGIIYIESELKLYIVKDGLLSEYNFKIPNPFTELFVISKNDDKQGALLIVGKGNKNSLAFDNLYIYNSDSNSVIDSNLPIVNSIKGVNISEITKENYKINNNLICDNISSLKSNSETGFRLYMINNKSVLEVDKLIVRDASNSIPIYDEYWLSYNNIIDTLEIDEEGEEMRLTLKYKHNYKVGDILKYYESNESDDSNEDSESNDDIFNPITVTIKEIKEGEKLIIEASNISNYNITNVFIFLIYTENFDPIRLKKNNLDIINYNSNLDEDIKTRIGNLTELELFNSKGEKIEGSGIYSSESTFLKALYIKEYELPLSDETSKLASTEWVQELIRKILPIGSIIMFNGLSSEIPENWAICNGDNGTPNLIDKFIKASGASGASGGSNTVTLTIDNLPSHNHTASISSSNNVSDSYKDKLIPAVTELFTDNTVDLGGSSHYFIETGYENKDDKGLVGIKVSDLAPSSSITIDNTGEGKPFSIEPEYYSLIFIMKIK